MPVSSHQVMKVNISYRSETFGGEDFEVNKPILYYILYYAICYMLYPLCYILYALCSMLYSIPYHTILYYIFLIFVVLSTVQHIAEPEITFKHWPENVQPKRNLIGNFQIWSAISLFHSNSRHPLGKLRQYINITLCQTLYSII